MNKQFEEWLWEFIKNDLHNIMTTSAEGFNTLPFSMQWGVYLEFFDSVGIRITVQHGANGFYFKTSGKVDKHGYTTRQEAQQEAIKKAFKILSE